jgi:hypothetical protein
MPAALALTDAQIEILISMARPLAPADRSGFLRAVAAALADLPTIGDGCVARAAVAAQRQFWRAPIEAD